MIERIREFVAATLIGALFGLGRLATTSELTVMRTAGLSLRKLAWMAIKPAHGCPGALVGEYVAPVSEQMAISQRALAQRDDPNMAGATELGIVMVIHLSMSRLSSEAA